MITAKEKARIIKVLGKHYTKSILIEFEKKQIFNTNLQPFISANIRKLIAGTWNKTLLETEILKFVKKTENNQKRQAEARKKLSLK